MKYGVVDQDDLDLTPTKQGINENFGSTGKFQSAMFENESYGKYLIN